MKNLVTEQSSIARMARVDKACLRFEDEWKAGRRPRLEDFLTDTSEADQLELLPELLLVEWEWLTKEQELQREEYHARFPTLRASVDSAWTRWMERVAGAETVKPSSLPDSNATTEPMPAIPGFEQVRELGRGGIGEVYLAFDPRLQRSVALKRVRFRVASTEVPGEVLARFHREALALAQLRHPNIVNIYELREHAGLPLLVLEYVEGGPLSRRLPRGMAIPALEAARLVAILARAMQHAHEKGIVHRDLKPENVLMDAPVAGTPAVLGGIPKIADLGLAGLCHSGHDLTAEGQVFGTPAYMAPELAAGQRAEIGTAVDIWALGVILYRCLSGVSPFAGDKEMDTLERVRALKYQPLREVVPEVPEDLEEVCLACLQKEPTARPTAQELAQRLERWCSMEEKRAESPSRKSRQWVLVGVGVLSCLFLGLIWHNLGGPSNDGKEEKPVAKVEPLKVELRVHVWEMLRGKEEPNGEIGKRVFQTHVADRVRIDMRFPQQAYCYLLCFNYDGTEQLLWPFDPDQKPSLADRLVYPPPAKGKQELLELREDDDNGGMQAFVVVSSTRQLPPYKEWRGRRGASPWVRQQARAGVWMSDGTTLDPIQPDEGLRRGSSNPRARVVTMMGQPPLLDVCQWASGEGVETVEGVLFGVLPPFVRK